MKKLYIPISTFNFNNILSSESISPKSFYRYRGFGYSRWLSIEENNVDNAILLYDKPFRFSRPTSDVEDHPMLVEIITDENFPQIVDGIYYSDHTIYLSPWRTKFIFFSEQVKRIVMSLSDSSLETKMMRIYGKRFVVEEYKQHDIPKTSLNIDLNKKEVSRDFRINKMKGLLYGYYIGALLSMSSDLVKKNNILQELQDIFYAVLSSEEQKLTSYQNERLDILLAKFNKSNPAIAFLQNQLANPNDIEYVVNQLSKYNVVFPRIVNKVSIINSLTYSKSEKNQALEWLLNEQNMLKRQILHERKILSSSEEEIVVTNFSLSKISNRIIPDEQENELMINWANEILSSERYNGNISSFKDILSDGITLRAKSQYQENWDNSLAKQTLNQIRKYVRGQESSFAWNNGLYSSIAAVLSKGNNWSDLLAFMKSKGMFDYRVAFAFYGELNGFANLTRDFTDYIFNIDNWEYWAEVYKEIYGQLLGVDPSLGYNSKQSKTSGKSKTEIHENVKSASDLSHKVMSAWNEIKKGRKNQKELLECLLATLPLNNEDMNEEQFLAELSLSSRLWDKSKTVWKALRDELTKSSKKIKEYSIPFEQNKEISLINDKDRTNKFNYDNIDFILCELKNNFSVLNDNEKLVECFKKDLEWVLDPKYSINLNVTILIDKFKEQLLNGLYMKKSSKGKDMTWKNTLYGLIDIEGVIQYLRKHFKD